MLKTLLERFARTKETFGEMDDPLLTRYRLVNFKPFGLYIQHLQRSDYDRALHDHPWDFFSFVLKGSYREHIRWHRTSKTVFSPAADEILERPRFSLAFRRAEHTHRVETAGCWTLVLRWGPSRREWGFWTAKGWVRHDIYAKARQARSEAAKLGWAKRKGMVEQQDEMVNDLKVEVF